MVTKAKRAQAMVEMALGMFLLALVAGALFSFGEIIMASLDQQDRVREEAGRNALDAYVEPETRVKFITSHGNDTVEVEPIAAEYLFDSQEVKVQNEVHMPCMVISATDEF